MLDVTNKGWLTAPQLQDALELYGQYAHKDDVYTFVRRHDRDSDGRLLFTDFCDAFIESADYNGKEMTDKQLEEINNNSDFVYECVLNYIQ